MARASRPYTAPRLTPLGTLEDIENSDTSEELREASRDLAAKPKAKKSAKR